MSKSLTKLHRVGEQSGGSSRSAVPSATNLPPKENVPPAVTARASCPDVFFSPAKIGVREVVLPPPPALHTSSTESTKSRGSNRGSTKAEERILPSSRSGSQIRGLPPPPPVPRDQQPLICKVRQNQSKGENRLTPPEEELVARVLRQAKQLDRHPGAAAPPPFFATSVQEEKDLAVLLCAERGVPSQIVDLLKVTCIYRISIHGVEMGSTVRAHA